MNIIAGIYQIVNTKNGKSYIGSSKNIKLRFGIHKSALKNNRHHCVHLQRSYNKHGIDTFKFDILKELIGPTEQQLFDEETKYIQELLPEYNIGSVGGGDNLTKHPNREDIVKRIADGVRERVAKMTNEEKKKIWGRPKEKNFNWRGGISTPKCDTCGKPLLYGHKKCSLCSKLGKNNPFYGKKHTDEYKKKASLRMKGKIPTNSRPVIIEGVVFQSVADAARHMNVCNATILFRIKSKYWNYEYVKPQCQT
jgi:group I intron endonuclease